MVRKKLGSRKKNKNKFSIHNEVNLAWRYVKECWKYIAVSTILFVLFFMSGFIFIYSVSDEILQPVLEQIKKWIEELIKTTEGFGFIEMWWFIFINNSTISFISIFSGFFLSLVPIFLLVSNGFVVGLMSSLVTNEAGFLSIWRLFPHGIFEIPAVIISFALGIKFGSFLFNKNPKKQLVYLFKNSLRVFIFIIIPLLVLASIIEAALIIFLN